MIDPPAMSDSAAPFMDDAYPPAPVQEVSPVQFEPLGGTADESAAAGLEMLSDVSIQICVELGRARMTVADVLGLKVGSVVELDKLAGEPGDVYINGTMIGRGEIVVVDERFGIRVFEVVDPKTAQQRL